MQTAFVHQYEEATRLYGGEEHVENRETVVSGSLDFGLVQENGIVATRFSILRTQDVKTDCLQKEPDVAVLLVLDENI